MDRKGEGDEEKSDLRLRHGDERHLRRGRLGYDAPLRRRQAERDAWRGTGSAAERVGKWAKRRLGVWSFGPGRAASSLRRQDVGGRSDWRGFEPVEGVGFGSDGYLDGGIRQRRRRVRASRRRKKIRP